VWTDQKNWATAKWEPEYQIRDRAEAQSQGAYLVVSGRKAVAR
jgi:hypothetical protein